MALNLANVQTTDTFQTWFTRTNQIIDSAFPTTGGTITGSLTVDGDALFSGNTTIVSKTTIETTDALLHLAANNEYSDILDIGFFAHYYDGAANNHTGIIRDSGTKEYYIFSSYSPGFEPTSDININHASFELANTHVNTLYANNVTVGGPATVSGYLQLTGTGQFKLPVGNTAQRVASTVGSLRYNNESSQFEGYGADGWGQIGGGGLGKFLFKDTTYTAEAGDRIAANTAGGAFTITLPATPSADDIVEFIDENNTFNLQNLTIARNGSTIEDVADDLVADVSGSNFYCQYDGSTWRVFGVATGTQYFNGTFSVAGLTVTGDLAANTATITNGLSAGSLSTTGAASVGSITVTESVVANTGSFTNQVSAQDFNSTSDVALKQNISTIDNASSIINQLRGVSFEWVNNNEPGYGVVAQEIESVIPNLVTTNNDGTKSVKYNGLIGFLLESNKQLLQRVETLEEKLQDK